MAERGPRADHAPIYRGVQRDAAQLEQRVLAQLKPMTDSWRVDETYVGKWLWAWPPNL